LRKPNGLTQITIAQGFRSLWKEKLKHITRQNTFTHCVRSDAQTVRARVRGVICAENRTMFRWTICEPFNPDVIEKGVIEQNQIFEKFQNYPWQTELAKVREKPDQIDYSPSVEFIDDSNESSIIFSIVEKGNESEFMIFYIVSKTVKGFLGIGTKKIKDHSEIYLNHEKAREALKAFVAQNKVELDEIFWN
jgi:hypothetical protein